MKEPPIINEGPAKEVPIEVLPPEPQASANAGAYGAPHARAQPRASHLSTRITRHSVAMAAAVLVDALQIVFFPVFAPGFVSVADVGLDFIAFAVFWRLVGWHPALLPSFVFEQLPLVDLAPSWTLAVWLAIRRNNARDASANPPEEERAEPAA